jgi:hypothetical protein
MDLTEKVETDTGLEAMERETNITIEGDKKEMRIYSAKKTVVKSLLEHDHFDLKHASGTDTASSAGEEGLVRFFNREQIERDAEEIHSVTGTMPLGCLTVKSAPRSNNNISSVVNAEGVDPEAFD